MGASPKESIAKSCESDKDVIHLEYKAIRIQ